MKGLDHAADRACCSPLQEDDHDQRVLDSKVALCQHPRGRVVAGGRSRGSTRRGFASGINGNLISADDQWRKLELVMSVCAGHVELAPTGGLTTIRIANKLIKFRN
jgi:hypothetical protein